MTEFVANSHSNPKRIVIVGSMGVYGKMIELAEELGSLGIPVVTPEEESEAIQQLSLFDFEEFKRKVSFSYLRKIRDPRTYAVLAVNLDRHQILNYIGPNTFAELAVAFGQSKKMYVYQTIPEAYLDELSAWQAIELRGRLVQLIDDFRRDCMQEDLQLKLPIG